MFQLLGQLLQQDSELGMILQTLFSFAFIIYLFYAQRIQGMTMLRQIETSLRKIKRLRDKGRETAIEAIKHYGKPEKDPTAQVERFMDHFMIPPVDMDPAGIVQKLGNVINVREFTFQMEVEQMAPQATTAQRNNLENLLEAGLALNVFYKVIRHYYLMGKKTMNIYIIMQIHMILPMIIQQIEAYSSALQAFKEGIPIGDSVGPIVAAKFINGTPTREIAKEMVVGETTFEGRRLVVAKALGPGGSVGKPGDAVENLIKEEDGKVKMLITVDAAGKLEGEDVGEIAEGVGAAIGGPGVEKYKIEKAAMDHNIPLFAVAIKQGMEHVVAPLVEELMDATDKAVSSVKGLILDYSEEGDTIIIAGIGNTVGVAQ
jgi:hypothetical protein